MLLLPQLHIYLHNIAFAGAAAVTTVDWHIVELICGLFRQDTDIGEWDKLEWIVCYHTHRWRGSDGPGAACVV